MTRRPSSSSASPDRWARRTSWYSGPPRTSEKSYGSGGGVAPSADVLLICPCRIRHAVARGVNAYRSPNPCGSGILAIARSSGNV